jgi:hypothetical protein
MKVVFTFCLLDRQRMPREALPAYLARVGIYREFNAAFFRLPPAGFAAWLETELLEAGAIERDGDDLVPARRGLAAG